MIRNIIVLINIKIYKMKIYRVYFITSFIKNWWVIFSKLDTYCKKVAHHIY